MNDGSPTPTPNESGGDVAWARHHVHILLSNDEPLYRQSQVLADRSPLALGVFVVATLYGNARKDFTDAEVDQAQRETRFDGQAEFLLDMAMLQRDQSSSREGTAQYVAEQVARRAVAGIDWEQLARDLISNREPAWAVEDDEEDGEEG